MTLPLSFFGAEAVPARVVRAIDSNRTGKTSILYIGTLNKKAWLRDQAFNHIPPNNMIRQLTFRREAFRTLDFALIDVENRQQFGHQQYVSYSLTQIRQFHLPALVADRGE